MENGKLKCHKYWPGGRSPEGRLADTQSYGEFTVSLKNEFLRNFYILRVFSLKRVKKLFSLSCTFQIQSITCNFFVSYLVEKLFGSSDGRVVRASASVAVDSGLIPSWVKPMTLKLVLTASLLDAQH